MGHRERLRERFKKIVGEGLADCELLELQLFRIILRRDVKPLAKDLLKRCDGLSGDLAAPIHRLAEVDGASEASALEFRILKVVFEFTRREDAKARTSFPAGPSCSRIANVRCGAKHMNSSARRIRSGAINCQRPKR
jgi:DNA repair protein RadC